MLIGIILTFLLAGLVKGSIGLGLPTIAMGLMSLWVSPIQAASVLLLPTILTNLWQLFAEGPFYHLFKRFFWFLVALCVGSWWSIFPTLGSAQAYLSEVLLGSMLLLYACYGLYVKNLPNLSRYERILSPVVGYLSGALCVATGVVIIPAAPYLNSLGLKKNELIQSLGLVFTVANLALMVFLAHTPQVSIIDDWPWSILALLMALLGMWAGQSLRQQISEYRFKRLFFYGLMLLGGYMLLHPLL
jgi:uncharacterized membrane protein YfcA